MASHSILFADISRPRLWGSDTLRMARGELVLTLKNSKTQPARYDHSLRLLAEIDAVLAERRATNRSRR